MRHLKQLQEIDAKIKKCGTKIETLPKVKKLVSEALHLTVQTHTELRTILDINRKN